MSRILFDPIGEYPACVHGYESSLALVDAKVSFVTSQMGLLAEKSIEKFDEIHIICDGKVAIVKEWDESLFERWRNGEIRGSEPVSRPLKSGKGSVFMGTTKEIVPWLRERVKVMRLGLIGATSDLVDGEYVPTDLQEPALDEFDRSVWELRLTPTNSVSKEAVRTSLMRAVGYEDIAEELIEHVSKGNNGEVSAE